MATTTPNFGWVVPTSTDLVKDGATAIETLGDSIDASLVDLKGGTTGQVLKKNSGTDMDFVWGADSAGMTNPMTTTGDIIYSSSGSTPARLGIGTSGQVIGIAAGVPAWTTPASATTSLSLVASGTLSGASLTLSSLSTYDDLVLIITNLNQSNSAQLRLRVNNNSTSNYWAVGFYQTGSSTSRLIRAADDSFLTAENVASGANGNEFVFELQNCKAAGFTSFGYSGSYNSTRVGEVAVSGMYAVAEAVSSLVLAPTAGTFSGGNYRIYGG
jgi:hypothetical protein